MEPCLKDDIIKELKAENATLEKQVQQMEVRIAVLERGYQYLADTVTKIDDSINKIAGNHQKLLYVLLANSLGVAATIVLK
jgi:septal ring factor EnvC (AmiA/AmiB activator)